MVWWHRSVSPKRHHHSPVHVTLEPTLLCHRPCPCLPPLFWSPWLPTAEWPGHALREGRQALSHLCLQRHPCFWVCFCQLHHTCLTQVVPCLETWLGSPCRHFVPQEFINAGINLDAKHMVSQSHNIKLNSCFSALRNRASSNFSSSDPVLLLFYKVSHPMLTSA